MILVPQRFSPKDVLCTEHIFFTNKDGDTQAFDAFVFKNIPEGKTDKDLHVIHRGVKKDQFKFSVVLKALPEFHRMLRYLQKDVERMPYPSMM